MLGLFLLFALLSCTAIAEQRFPPPDFEGGHQLPGTTTPPAREVMLQYLDVAVLGASLALASWLVFKPRSRKGLIALSIFSLLYFGFWRKAASARSAQCRTSPWRCLTAAMPCRRV